MLTIVVQNDNNPCSNNPYATENAPRSQVFHEGRFYTKFFYAIRMSAKTRLVKIIQFLAITILTCFTFLALKSVRRLWTDGIKGSVHNAAVLMGTPETDSLNMVSKQVLRGASLKANPEMTEFQCDGCKITVVNHTSNQIHLTPQRELFVNGELFTDFTQDDCQIIAYSLEGIPELLCIEQKDVASAEILQRLVVSTLSYLTRIDDERQIVYQLPEIAEKIHQKNIFTPMLLGFKSENSFFQENGVTKDIMLPLIECYRNMVESEYTIEKLDELDANYLRSIATRPRRDGPAGSKKIVGLTPRYNIRMVGRSAEWFEENTPSGNYIIKSGS